MRLLFISLASVFVVFILIFTTRMWGLGVVHTEFQHPFFSAGEKVVVVKASSASEIDSVAHSIPKAILWLDVKTTSDQKLIVFFKELSDKDMSFEAYRGPQSFAYTYQQLANQNPEVRLLRDLVSANPSQRFVLNIADNVENVHLWTVEALKGLNAEKRVILQSNFNVVMESIKKLEPMWLYGCSQADLMRFLTFESMWLLPATPFKGDVYIAPFQLLKRPAFHESTVEELHRRHRKVLLGPLVNKAEFDNALRLKADGLIVEDLADYLAWSRP